MSEKMCGYIRSQPKTLLNILENRREYLAAIDTVRTRGAYGRILLVGSGSSYNACSAARPFMEKLYGREITVITPSTRRYVAPDADTLVLAVSQEGASSNTYGFVKSLPQETMTAAVTALPGSLLTGICRATLVIGCGNEAIGPKTVGVTATVLTLWLTALELRRAEGRMDAPEYETAVQTIRTALEELPDVIAGCEAWVGENIGFFSEARAIAVIARNDNLGAAQESALKLNETIYIQSTAYDFEEFLHGPSSLFEKRSIHVLLLTGPGEDMARCDRLISFAVSRGVQPALICAGTKSENAALTLRVSAPDTAPLALMVPAQFAAAVVSEAMGQPVDAHDFSEFSTLMQSKLK